jgi:multiple sugar transport system substrate-binding protein
MDGVIHEHDVTPATVTTMTEESTRRMFQSGRAIFMRNWPYAWPLLSADGSPVAGRVGVTTLPSFEGHRSAPTLGGYHLGINVNSPHPDEAAEFVTFMIRETSQKEILLRMARLPAHRAVYDDVEVRAAMPYLVDLLPALELARPRPVTPYYLMISQVLQPELSAVVTGLRPPAEAMVLAAQQIDRLMASTQ